jgi:translocation and assembly module TamA
MPTAAQTPTRPRRHRTWVACVLLALTAGACSRGDEPPEELGFEEPETAVSYEVVLEGSPSEEISALAEAALSSYRLREDGAPSTAFLRRRADGDLPLLLKILRSQGYYSATAEARVEEVAAGEGEPLSARIVLIAEPGPAYTLIEHRLLVSSEGGAAIPDLDPAALGSPVGSRAVASDIAGAESAAVAALTKAGFPYAQFDGRKGLADPEAATLQVDSTIGAGGMFRFGPIGFEGAESVDHDYLRTYLPWSEGDVFDTTQLRKYQRRLIATGLFRAATVRPPENPPAGAPPDSALPVSTKLEEAPPRSVSASLRYDTDLGAAVRGTFEHRNLFGANEQLLAEAEIGLIEQHLGVGLKKPQFLRPGQDLLGSLTFARETFEAYESIGVTGALGLERELNEQWKIGFGGLAEVTQIEDNGGTALATLLGAPVFVAYDNTVDLLNPVDGTRLRLEATPFLGAYDSGDTEFLVLDGTGSVYLPLDGEKAYVLAARGRMGAILSPDLTSIPQTRRLYSGGGGSVRGFAQDFVGPLDPDNNPVGGRSAIEAGVEMRARLFGDIGGVAFVDAGSVSTNVFPDFAEGVQVAAGLGLRYYSPAGPIRVDVAVPVNGRKADDAWQLYFSIGQAF